MTKLACLTFVFLFTHQSANEEEMKALLRRIRTSDSVQRAEAFYKLKEYGIEPIHGLIEAWYQEKDKPERIDLRVDLVQLMGQLGTQWDDDKDPRYEELISGLATIINTDPAESVREFAIEEFVKQTGHRRTIVGNLRHLLTNEQEHFRVRRSSAIALGRLGLDAKDTLPELISTLGHKEPDVRQSAAKAIGKIALALRDAEATDSIDQLEHARTAIEKAGLTDQLEEVKGAIHLLHVVRRGELKSVIRDVLTSYWIVRLILGWILVWCSIWALILLVRPLALPAINEHLSQEVDVKLLGQELKGRPNHLCLLSLFAYHSRVLRKWVGKNRRSLSEAFDVRCGRLPEETMNGVSLFLDGEQIDSLLPQRLQQIFAQRRACLLIRGDASDARMFVARRVANWAGSADTSRQMTPVMLTHSDLVSGVASGKGLMGSIRERVVTITGEALDARLLGKLVTDKRILVIVDGFSDLNEDERATINFTDADSPINALIVTSRNHEDFGGITTTEVTMKIQRAGNV